MGAARGNRGAAGGSGGRRHAARKPTRLTR